MSSTSTPPTDRTLAIFGATGRTGSETLKALLAKPNNPFTFRIFVRSRDKLISKFPQLKTSRNVTIIEGQVTDVSGVRDCLNGADTIICALGDNDNKPIVRVLQDATKSIVTALKQLQGNADGDWKRPRFILLSSATWNKRFNAQTPIAVKWLIKNAFYYPYADLLKAHETLQAEPELVKLLLVQPPAIIEEEASGYTISAESVGIAVSYGDLGAAFAELATEEAYEDIGAVGVTSGLAKQGFPRYAPEILQRVIIGLMASFIPGFWRLIG
ncbi:afli avfa cytochrome p450 monooxygenase [Colletotrichum incanum]|uniref:Afli avfa cytochrome p450 monooxygenase n=1 Tax=Colletotrichum incanum TaxID=1573173 RepID=A0A166UQ52_COLIC|nr:afli avfa cytochrome p450 monooxygenase [Colletotrichum incanum]OHW96086.1 afli avfa cytochrome p450 monooxygenase [Colletotrichum incanum]